MHTINLLAGLSLSAYAILVKVETENLLRERKNKKGNVERARERLLSRSLAHEKKMQLTKFHDAAI